MSTIIEVPKAILVPTSTPISAATPSVTPVQLLSGIGGAIGSAFLIAQNQLVFVEYNKGDLSALNLFSPSTVVSSGATILKGTFVFNLDSGIQGGPQADADLWWDQQTTVDRRNHETARTTRAFRFKLNHLDLPTLRGIDAHQALLHCAAA
jgi:hypothetical protein